MCAQGTGNNEPNNPLDFFERSIRSIEESSGPIPDLQIDRLLRFGDVETERLFDALRKIYPDGHWAVNHSNFQHTIEKAMQLLSAGLCDLGANDQERVHPLECCTRIVNSPTLSPYVLKNEYNYVIIPTGFISSLEKFISSTYAMAAIATSQLDPDKNTILWEQDLFLSSIANFADTNIFTYTRGIIEASLESSMQKVVEDFFDSLVFSSFDRDMHKELMKSMPSASSWDKLGYKDLGEALNRHQEIMRVATKIARLTVCFTICHEFGHVFSFSIDAEGADELAVNETFADMTGILILQRLVETKIIAVIVGSEVTYKDLGHALAGFHSWNLSKELGTLLNDPKNINIKDVLTHIHEVASRWEQAMKMIREVWVDDVSSLSNVGEKISTGWMITNHWGVMTAGMLRVALLKNGHKIDIETACKVLPSLANRDSKIYKYLGG